ncbi:sugar transferase [Thomasclavelia spiroformis]|uniref:sugar transferase n=1 Tax=Thomasclavelia spiroformis TaxID=29348 RepID=UPI0026DB7992|nr:sugar transferase [Thomasclavelia spiroformis]
MLLKKWDDLPGYMKNNKVKLYYDELSKKRFSLILKRFFDIIMALILIIILSPVFLLIGMWIKCDSEGSIFYRQERVTQYGRIFKIFKFRTMVSNADKIGTLVTTQNDSRITKVGEKIRKVRLDELPQLFNILVGDMSFVGTRPEVKKYVDEYSDEMYATLLLPAGVTSLASIKFKDEDELLNKADNADVVYVKKILPEKMKYNLESVREFSFWKEFDIMVKTVLEVTR